MAASLLHFGQELASCFPYLRKAGYGISRYEAIAEFHEALRSETAYDAVSLSDLEDGESEELVDAVRTHSPTPLILFLTR